MTSQNDHNLEKYNSEIWFFFLFSRFRIFRANLNTLRKKIGKKYLFKNVRTFKKRKNKQASVFCMHAYCIGMQHQNNFFFQKWSNLHERKFHWLEIERKIKFRIFPIFIFRVMVIFVIRIVNFRLIFSMNLTRKIKIGKLFFQSFQHIAHLSWKWDQNRGGQTACRYLGQSLSNI